jgi:hypothetical protein
MADLLPRIIGVFETPLGQTALGLTALAFAALFIIVFWDGLRRNTRDRVEEGRLDTAPPPLMPPQLVGRKSEPAQRYAFGGTWVRTGLLVVIVAAAAVTGLNGLSHLSDRSEAVTAGFPAASGAQAPTAVAVAARAPRTPAPQVSAYCDEKGSISDRYFEICARDAAVRFDLLRLTYDDRMLLRPVWTEKAPTFIEAASQPAPMALGQQVSFARPETMRRASYDGFLVLGTARPSFNQQEFEARKKDVLEAKRRADSSAKALSKEELAAVEQRYRDDITEQAHLRARRRAERLRDFAIAELSGGDRSECETSERVYAVSALFDEAMIARLAVARSEFGELEKNAKKPRAHAKAVADYHNEAVRLRAMELTIHEEPAPLLLGITADPLSSNQDADVRAAINRLLERQGEDLQVRDVRPVGVHRACARGGEAQL